MIALLILRNIINNHRASSYRGYIACFVFWGFGWEFENSIDVAECCVVGCKCGVVGCISVCSNWDFSPLKGGLFDFQLIT